MSLSGDDRMAIVAYRKEKAYVTLKEAEDINARTHNGVVGLLGQNFVSTGLLTKEEGRLYSRLLQNRITGDYNDFFDFMGEDVIPLRDRYVIY